MRFMRVLPLLPLALFLSACGGGGNSGLTTTGTNGQNQFAGGPLAITTPSILPATLQGQQYSVTLVATNGQGALHWSIAPSSPTALFVNGLTIDPSTGIVSGTVNWSGTAGFVGTVTDSASPPHEAGANFTVVAYQKLQSAASQAITVNEFQDPIAVRTGIVGGFPPVSYRVSSGSIAPGLKFDSTGALVGEAYQQGSYQFTITGQDSFNPPQTATQSFTLTVRPPPLTVNTTIPFRVTLNRPFSGKVVALGGTPPYSYALSFPANLPAGFRSTPVPGF